MNELEQALDNVVEHGMKVIDSLTPEQLSEVMSILDKVK